VQQNKIFVEHRLGAVLQSELLTNNRNMMNRSGKTYSLGYTLTSIC
jgi:hypothetical protein